MERNDVGNIKVTSVFRARYGIHIYALQMYFIKPYICKVFWMRCYLHLQGGGYASYMWNIYNLMGWQLASKRWLTSAATFVKYEPDLKNLR